MSHKVGLILYVQSSPTDCVLELIFVSFLIHTITRLIPSCCNFFCILVLMYFDIWAWCCLVLLSFDRDIIPFMFPVIWPIFLWLSLIQIYQYTFYDFLWIVIAHFISPIPINMSATTIFCQFLGIMSYYMLCGFIWTFSLTHSSVIISDAGPTLERSISRVGGGLSDCCTQEVGILLQKLCSFNFRNCRSQTHEILNYRKIITCCCYRSSIVSCYFSCAPTCVTGITAGSAEWAW